jgi:hypothetical protein
MKTFTGTPIGTVRNANGIAFNVRLVRKGDGYGRNLCLTHEKDDPLVEFYDARYLFSGEAGAEFGQFVSRYYLSTLQACRMDRRAHGLCLEGGVPDWTVDSGAMQVAYALLDNWTR